MSEKVKDTLDQAKPWRSNVPWWLVLAEGVIAVVLGLYLILATEAAAGLIIRLIALFLLVAGLFDVTTRFVNPVRNLASTLTIVRGVIGLVTGALIFLSLWLDFLSGSLMINLLALGMIAYGLLGLFVVLITRGEKPPRWMVIINSALFLIIGILLFGAGDDVADVIATLGWVLTLGGLALAGYGIYTYRQLQQGLGATAEPPAEEQVALEVDPD